MKEITLQNQYFTYSLHVTEEGHLEHRYFLPQGHRAPEYTPMRRCYPYEVVIGLAESNTSGWRFGDCLWRNDASHDLVFRDMTKQGDLTVLTLYNRQYNLEVQLCYIVHPDSPAIVRYTRVINRGDKALELRHISSFVLSGFPYYGRSSDLYLHSYHSAWALEGEEKTEPFTDLGLLAPGCRSGWSYQNISAFSTQRRFPYFVIEERSSQLFWGIQIESGSHWRAEIAGGDTVNPDWFYIQGGLPNFLGSLWFRTLKPGEDFTTPKAALTVSEGRIDDIYNHMHVYQRRYLITHPEPDRSLPVIFNDWQALRGHVSERIIHDQLDELKKAGVEIYVTDSGWYHSEDQDWSEYVGCWTPDPVKFPNGLSAVAGDIRAHGMIPGIWCEIEMVGPHSRYYNDEDMLLTYNGRPLQQWHRRFLDFRRDKVRRYASGIIKMLYDAGFRYLKIDYNADCSPACDGPYSPVENLRMARMAYGDWLRETLDRFPDLILEHCASGGMKLDYDNLTRGSLASITDQWNCLHTGSIFANVSKLVDPSQCENWSTIKPDMDVPAVRFTLTNSMMGRFCISALLSSFSDEQKNAVRAAVSFYKKYRDIIPAAGIFYHTAPRMMQAADNLKVVEYTNGEKSMVWISAHDYGGSFTFRPEIENFELLDSFPDTEGISFDDSLITLSLKADQTFGCLLILKKKS